MSNDRIDERAASDGSSRAAEAGPHGVGDGQSPGVPDGQSAGAGDAQSAGVPDGQSAGAGDGQSADLLLADAHESDIADVARSLGVDLARGLDAAEVSRRAAASGPNALGEKRRQPLWRMLVEAATEPFVLLLAVAGVLAIALGETRDGVLVLIGLVPIVGSDVVTEYRGDRALEALRAASAPRARVRREGAVADVPAADLVPGDVALLQAGDVVPADIRIAVATRLLLDRSVLTGESVPEPGRPDADPPGTDLVDRRSMAFAGTSVVGGRAEGIVVAIGQRTEFGRIAGGLQSRERRRSPLQRELDRLVRILLAVAIGLIVITTGAGFARGHALGENVLAGISAAIASIPEEPPVLLAVVLGLGAYRLLRRGVLVRRLNAEETLGAVDLIVTDKTGTLTRNRLEVSSVRTREGAPDDAQRLALLIDAYRAEEDAWPGEGVAPASFTRALAAAIRSLGGDATVDSADLLAAAPASESYPVTRTSARRDGRIEDLALGAPEVVVAMATEDGSASRDAWLALLSDAASSGERLVALAGRVRREDAAASDHDSAPGGTTASDGEPGPWQMRALVGFADPLRPGIAEAMATARRAGIQVVVVTGDHPLTAAAIAREAGLEGDRVVTGDEVAAWDDTRLAGELGRLHVVARSTPQQKQRLVGAARADRRIVAVTGDGVNDAPALHGADVAVAMGSGTAVAKEASDLVLGDDSFATLMFGLAEGRRIVDNVQKGLVFLLSTHAAFLGFILIATLFAGAEGQPLLPIQILWMELFIDTSTSIAFEREPPEPDLMERPPRHADRPLLSVDLLARLAMAGTFTAVAALVVMLTVGGGFVHARWLAYTTLVVSQCVRAYANRSLRTPLRRLAPNWVLAAACAVAIGIQALLPIVPPLADAFRAVPLGAGEWLLVLAIALAPAAVAEVARSRRGAAWVA